jgi:hypothetical protein
MCEYLKLKTEIWNFYVKRLELKTWNVWIWMCEYWKLKTENWSVWTLKVKNWKLKYLNIEN